MIWLRGRAALCLSYRTIGTVAAGTATDAGRVTWLRMSSGKDRDVFDVHRERLDADASIDEAWASLRPATGLPSFPDNPCTS